jgi:hypothetical protein
VVLWLHGADRVAILGECELDADQRVPGFEPADFDLADSVKFLEARVRECGRGRRDRPREG